MDDESSCGMDSKLHQFTPRVSAAYRLQCSKLEHRSSAFCAFLCSNFIRVHRCSSVVKQILIPFHRHRRG